jgi:hypothetical protein
MNWLRQLFCNHSWEMIIDDDDEDIWRRNFMRYFVCRKCNKTRDRMR